MSPKEKAEQLVTAYYDSIMSFLSDNIKQENAKKCALIAVDEILINFGQVSDGANFYTSYAAVKFYQEVKAEIENL